VNYGIIALTKNALKLANKIKDKITDSSIYTLTKWEDKNAKLIDIKFHKFIKKIFKLHDVLIFIMASGIVVRAISRYIKRKDIDPAILVIDEKGEYVISLLSGHIGKANESAKYVADKIKAKPVITTSSDLNNKISVDILAEKLNCRINDLKRAKEVTSLIVNDVPVKVVSDNFIKFPHYLDGKKNIAKGFINITNKKIKIKEKNNVILIPRNIIIGIGCKKGICKNIIIKHIKHNLKKLNIDRNSIKSFATIDLKKDEKGILKKLRINSVNPTLLKKKPVFPG
jgi:cobalt-precorrin 5A hydrolase